MALGDRAGARAARCLARRSTHPGSLPSMRGRPAGASRPQHMGAVLPSEPGCGPALPEQPRSASCQDHCGPD
eukprot:15443787-Alexandrium_andersonii.AAC.1